MSAESEGREAAAAFRREHGLGTQPLGDLVALIEQTTGIDVAVLDVDLNEHGLTMFDPVRNAVVVGVTRTRNPMRQRSTLAHELAHVLFKDWTKEPNVHSGSHEESRANVFARHLLIPVEGVQEIVGAVSADLGTLSKVVQLFEVSPAIAAIAMQQAGYIDWETKELWMSCETAPRLAARFGWSDHYEALQEQSDKLRAPQKLIARLTAGYVDNVVSAQTIATVREMDAEDLVRRFRDDGIEPRELTIAWADAEDLPEVEVDFSDWDDDEDTAG
ncbi:ImmA/IrrE family metallo-endopeptidase [Rhodococcus opacus]|uniref:IrrE N-terminal-like domain-containing protein n=1 Tax=Rhodococcus opacus TaxID=37919 RepID=A0A076F1L0_RHOOP|nr:ImmA/IrrE family metallo-endopeptidase [Rhodococcus opacus]AII11483.1 hypothetical protein EP51_46825 [Rhodococcus opacus]